MKRSFFLMALIFNDVQRLFGKQYLVQRSLRIQPPHPMICLIRK